MKSIIIGILIPFLGTTAGSACVFFMRKKMDILVQKGLMGFAAGIMVAASFWSLLLPALEMEAAKGRWAVLSSAIGFSIGIAFLYLLDKVTPHIHLGSKTPEGPRTKLSRTGMLAFAVTLHNIPEGMAVGVVFAGYIQHSVGLSLAAAMALSIGIAIQNFPEGAIISMPMSGEGRGKLYSFTMGTLSGLVEPIGAVVTILLASTITPWMPYFLSFAAGAMIYVVVEELIPEASRGEHSDWGTIGFAIGFVLMMVLDVIFA